MRINDKLLVLFLLENSKKCKKGKVPIYVRITVEGSPRAEMSLGRKINPYEWDQENEKVIVNSKNKELSIISTTITQYRAKLEKNYFVLNSQFETVGSQMLKSFFWVWRRQKRNKLNLKKKKKKSSWMFTNRLTIIPMHFISDHNDFLKFDFQIAKPDELCKNVIKGIDTYLLRKTSNNPDDLKLLANPL